MEYNKKHGIVPTTIVKEVHDLIEATRAAEEVPEYRVAKPKTKEGLKEIIEELEKEMNNAAAALEFEKAAKLRDEIFKLKEELESSIY